MRTNVPIAMRLLRRRRGWLQEDLGRRAGLSRDAVSRAERGMLDGLTVGSLARLVAALDGTVTVEIRWRGAELDRLLDRHHAAIQDAAARRLTRSGWLVRAEVSFNHFGDRGRCDLVGLHPPTGTLLVVEVKSRIGDIQETLGRLDVKARVGAILGRGLGWAAPRAIGRALVFGDDSGTRRILRSHAALFQAYGVRGRSAQTWLRNPGTAATGLLWFEKLSGADHSRTQRR